MFIYESMNMNLSDFLHKKGNFGLTLSSVTILYVQHAVVYFTVVTKLTAVPKGIVCKVLNDAIGLVKLDLVKIDDHVNHAVMQMLIAFLPHRLFQGN